MNSSLVITFVSRELKRKQALLRSNLPGIDSSLYAVKARGHHTLVAFFFTDIAICLRKPISVKSLPDTLLSVDVMPQIPLSVDQLFPHVVLSRPKAAT